MILKQADNGPFYIFWFSPLPSGPPGGRSLDQALSSHLLIHLGIINLPVFPTGSHQFFMLSTADDFSCLHDENLIRFHDGGDPLGNDDFRRLLQCRLESLPYFRLRRRIYRTGTIIQNQNLRFF